MIYIKLFTCQLILITGVSFVELNSSFANTEPGYISFAGEFEAAGPEKKLCSHCEAACTVSDNGVDRGDQSCDTLRKRAALLANGGSPSSRPSGADDQAN